MQHLQKQGGEREKKEGGRGIRVGPSVPLRRNTLVPQFAKERGIGDRGGRGEGQGSSGSNDSILTGGMWELRVALRGIDLLYF